MEIKATQKFLLMSPNKIRRVVPMIKEMSPIEALEVLPFIGKRAAEPLAKVIGTAIANAKDLGADEASLSFKEIQVNQGPGLKRWRAGARGRVKPYKRRMSHIRVVLQSKEKKLPKKSKKSEGKVKSKKVSLDKIKEIAGKRKSVGGFTRSSKPEKLDKKAKTGTKKAVRKMRTVQEKGK
jgi:large subunit ribosomal protein L22